MKVSVSSDAPALAVVGAGRAATGLALAAQAAGRSVLGAWSRSPASAERFGLRLRTPLWTEPVPLCQAAGLVLIGASDDAISPLCRQLADAGAFRPGQTVLHLSGAHSSAALEAARARGASVASCHPLMTFPVPALSGVAFAIEGDADAAADAAELARSVGGEPFLISAESKPLYHAAAVTLCGALVGLHELAARLFSAAGLEPDAALRAALPLVDATLANIRRSGRERALTGPAARGDLGTIRSHLQALSSHAPDLLPAYRALTRLAAGVASRRDGWSADLAQELDRLLEAATPGRAASTPRRGRPITPEEVS